jgi:hypothetical protein
VNFPFFVVLVAAVCGLGFDSVVKGSYPEAGPAVALALMAMALILGARLLGRRRVEKAAEHTAGQSLNPA